MIVFRLLVVIGVGYPLYQDEQTKFTCDTMQPGCSNVCYDAFFPVSHCRFWFVQAIVLCLPVAFFILHVAHRMPMQNAKASSLQCLQNPAETSSIRKEPVRSASTTRKSQELNLHLMDIPDEAKAVNEDLRIRQRTLNFCEAYVLQLLLRTLLEAGFGVGQYYLFGFLVPNRFVCSSYPCANRVTCYPSRPTEKTLLVNFMFGATALSFLLNFVDLIYVIKQAVKQNKKNKLQMKHFYQAESYHDIPSEPRELPEHSVVQEHEMHVTERRESGASAGSEAKSCKSGQEEGTCVHSGVLSEDVALSNTNSNNTHLTVLMSSPASMREPPDRKLALFEKVQGTSSPAFSSCAARLPGQQGSRLRQHTLLKPTQAPPSNSQLIDEYRLVHMRVTDSQSNCSTGSRRKKSEWV
ncbi:gap junction delta-2 protein [Chiloscyllium plagiosum]|uniref:gap junction delta-2 protein n=1 Tax=Chiloscyllium plagiosum TaxID=36176 RepID=UPI001CB885B0|nr:gap junction delta-2 protein [Chiloscyllium plagiosum]